MISSYCVECEPSPRLSVQYFKLKSPAADGSSKSNIDLMDVYY